MYQYYKKIYSKQFSFNISKELFETILEAKLHIMDIYGSMYDLTLKELKSSTRARELFKKLTAKTDISFGFIQNQNGLWYIEITKKDRANYPSICCKAIHGLPAHTHTD